MEGTRRDSVMSSLHHEYGDMGRERDNPGGGGNGGASRADVLADLTKLQREIDELRIQSEKEKASIHANSKRLICVSLGPFVFTRAPSPGVTLEATR